MLDDSEVVIHNVYSNQSVDEENMEHSIENAVVTITYEELMRLREDSFKLQCLRNHGVDNWCGYGEAMRDFYEQSDGDE